MTHERLDLGRWIAEFPFGEFEDARAMLAGTSGPCVIALTEQIRSRFRSAGVNLGSPVPVDVCVWELGESRDRQVTKIGGCPYWPEHEPWPHLDRQTPLTFVAQLCFADSRDILPRLPGDILSIFALADDFMELYTCWHSIRVKKLLPPRQMPAPRWEIEPCHAVLHRTSEYPAAPAEAPDTVPYPLSNWSRGFRDWTKMGGTWLLRGELLDPGAYDDPVLRREIEDEHAKVQEQQRQFIATLGSITLADPWPFVNVPDAGALRDRQKKRLLTISDCGGYDFFFDGKRTEHSWWSC